MNGVTEPGSVTNSRGAHSVQKDARQGVPKAGSGTHSTGGRGLTLVEFRKFAGALGSRASSHDDKTTHLAPQEGADLATLLHVIPQDATWRASSALGRSLDF